ncbi:hypothetical protein SAMN04489724_1897 [Algoriphagus locisalis]|uniref:Lipoprotein n=1 Tax=Algoriphagus locisalis TaxID=305507 RepID=A0A1I7AEB0_9BACT|nr:hypothetical protein [Algoriphagus locisalis]SFT73264.1 hypothetical protein SAMN04489724_1897 [Algoriphagus locisalis]
MRLNILLWTVVLFASCNGQKVEDEIENSIDTDKKELVIIFNRLEPNTVFHDRSSDGVESFQYMREGFYDPNLHIRVSHDIDFRKKVITRKDLDSKIVWFDQEMGYTDWFHLSSLETYFIIYEDDYLVKGSLDPDYEFKVYEVSISTGGIM